MIQFISAKDLNHVSTAKLRETLIEAKRLKGEDKAFALVQPRSIVLGMLLGWPYKRMIKHYKDNLQENLLSDTNGVMQ